VPIILFRVDAFTSYVTIFAKVIRSSTLNFYFLMSFFYIILASVLLFDLWHPNCSSITTLSHIVHSVYTAYFNAKIVVPY